MASLTDKDIGDEWEKADALSLHLESIKLVIGTEGRILWKVLNTSVLFSKEEGDIFEQKHNEVLLQSMLQTWLNKPNSTWKFLYEALNKAPEPGPKIAEVIITTHKMVVETEKKERFTYGLRPVISEDNLCSLSNQGTNVSTVVQSLDLLSSKLLQKSNETMQMFKKSNDEFVKEVQNDWEQKVKEDRSMQSAIATSVDDIKTIVEQLREWFFKIKDHLSSCSTFQDKLQKELPEAEMCYNDAYFQQLEPRISRLKRLQSSKADLLISTQQSMLTVLEMIATGKKNITKCHTMIQNDKTYLSQLPIDVKAANGALDRIRDQLVRYKSVKKEEIEQFETISKTSSTVGRVGLAVGGIFFAIATVATGGAALGVAAAAGAIGGGAAIISSIASSVIESSKSAIAEYENQIQKCSAYSKSIQAFLSEMQKK